MEGAKTAMYAQAVKNRGWSTVPPANDDAEILTPPIMPTIPEPPVVELPVMERLDTMMPQEDCQTLAMAFAEMQKWQKLYETEHGFSRGTIFAELDLPFMGKGDCKDG